MYRTEQPQLLLSQSTESLLSHGKWDYLRNTEFSPVRTFHIFQNQNFTTKCIFISYSIRIKTKTVNNQGLEYKR